MFSQLKDYFSFNKKERNGILLLSFILFFLILFYQFSYLLKTDTKTDFSDFEKAIAELENFKQQTIIDTLYISKTNINTATIENLRNHPYLNYKQAKMIVNYRIQHGDFRSIKDIQKIRPISQEIFRKIAAYFQTHD